MSRLATLAALLSLTLAVHAQFPASRIAAGPHHTCAIGEGGNVYCWGENAYGALGDGTRVDRQTPVRVQGLPGPARDVDTGHSITCAVLEGDTVWCWGKQILALANTSEASRTATRVPVQVPNLAPGATKLSLDDSNACAVTTSGGLKCWGYNYSGQLADGTTTHRDVPTGAFVPGLASGIREVTTNGLQTCVLTIAGGVKCWGINERGRLGDGTTTSRMTPGDVTGLANGVASLSRGEPRCALMQTGAVMCWGPNSDGSVGDGTRIDRLTPVAVGLRGPATMVAAAGSMACAALDGGGLQCWGYSQLGLLGRGGQSESLVPVSVLGITGRVTSLTLDTYHACVVVEGEGPKCWGDNFFQALGDGTSIDRLMPTSVWSKPFPPSYQGLWWAAPAGSESGWGVSIAQQGDTAFVAWFTYGADTKPAWYVVPEATGSVTFHGKLYSATGPAFSSSPWDPGSVRATEAGTVSVHFHDHHDGELGFCPLNGACSMKPITRQLFSAQPECLAGGERTAPWNFTDLWWASPAGSESGWGLSVTHQGDTVFGVWYTYDAGGVGQWLVMPNGALSGQDRFAGTLYRTSGPGRDELPWDPGRVTATAAGSATLSFEGPDNGTFAYTLDGIAQSKAIIRQVFGLPATVCNR